MHNLNFKQNRSLSVEEAMCQAIQMAEASHTVFAAIILDEQGIILDADVNTGKQDGPTAHAEMNVLRKATAKGHLPKGTKLVTTCEPCPMCMGAAVWARVDTIYYGVSIKQAAEFIPQIILPTEEIASRSFHQPRIVAGCCFEDCLRLFENFFGMKS